MREVIPEPISPSPINFSKEIEGYLKNPPNSWRKMFREQGIPETPTIKQVLSLLSKTAGGYESLETETSSSNPKTYKPTKAVRDAAMKGIRLSYKHNYPSYNGIGLARAIQLAVEPTVWKRTIERMSAFFGRNKRYENLSGFNNDTNPSKSYLAWLNWGGTPGRDWANSH